jgi:hypothetical protein
MSSFNREASLCNDVCSDSYCGGIIWSELRFRRMTSDNRESESCLSYSCATCIQPKFLVMKKSSPAQREQGLAAWAEPWSVGVGSGRARQPYNDISRTPFQKKLCIPNIVESRADVRERTFVIVTATFGASAHSRTLHRRSKLSRDQRA